jgi:riboflavin kinase/FMN adenylyltransferase
MELHIGCENLHLKDPVVTIGIFDGVHRGHRVIIDRLISQAKMSGGESVIITFNPHPRLVLENESANISFLTTLEEKTALLSNAGADHLIIIKFDRELSSMTAPDFIREILIAKIGMRHLIVGHDHHFGNRGRGDFQTIARYSRSANFTVEQLPEIKDGNITISSSLIREALLSGELDKANKWLGYNYSLKGVVIEGRKIGRELGFPTANIKPLDSFKLIPADGVYAVEVKMNGTVYKAMLSIGFNPTVRKQRGERSIEVHIFDFKQSIYDLEIEIVFRHRLRDEIKFSDAGALARQIESDKVNALKMLT